MRRTHYNAVVILKESANGIFKYSYSGFRKIRYKMTGDKLKLWIYHFGGHLETIEYTNVSSVKVTKYKR